MRFQVIKLLFETLKNEKFLHDIQTKCGGNIANEILNVAIDTDRTFKLKCPKRNTCGILGDPQGKVINQGF